MLTALPDRVAFLLITCRVLFNAAFRPTALSWATGAGEDRRWEPRNVQVEVEFGQLQLRCLKPKHLLLSGTVPTSCWKKCGSQLEGWSWWSGHGTLHASGERLCSLLALRQALPLASSDPDVMFVGCRGPECSLFSMEGCIRGWPFHVRNPPQAKHYYWVEVGWYIHLTMKHFLGYLPCLPCLPADKSICFHPCLPHFAGWSA